MENNQMVEAKWYVVHTFSGYENMVMANLYKVIEKNNLQDIILDVKIKPGNYLIISIPLFFDVMDGFFHVLSYYCCQ